jgi:uncharacterized membrane protein
MTDAMLAPATADAFRALHETGTLTSAAYRRALQLAVGTPPSSRWKPFLSSASLILGASMLLAGAVYFFAFNWEAMPRLLRFGVLEAGIAGAGLFAILRPTSPARSVALGFAAVLLGPLLAVYAQEYQTGADPWELFAGWTLLALPFAIVARWTPLWMLLGVLANVGLSRWFQERGFDAPFNGVVLAHWTLNAAICAGFAIAAPGGRWGARFFALAALAPPLFLSAVWTAFPGDHWFSGSPRPVLFAATVTSVAVLLSAFRKDLFMLSLSATGALVLLGSFAWRLLSGALSPDDYGHLPMAALLIVGVGLAVWLLKRAQRAPGVRA